MTLLVGRRHLPLLSLISRLNYPNGRLQKIKEMDKEPILKMAVDFDVAKGHPRLAQVSLIPKKPALKPLVYGMDYKQSSAKAVLNIVSETRGLAVIYVCVLCLCL